jgi:hypothetical protein
VTAWRRSRSSQDSFDLLSKSEPFIKRLTSWTVWIRVFLPLFLLRNRWAAKQNVRWNGWCELTIAKVYRIGRLRFKVDPFLRKCVGQVYVHRLEINAWDCVDHPTWCIVFDFGVATPLVLDRVVYTLFLTLFLLFVLFCFFSLFLTAVFEGRISEYTLRTTLFLQHVFLLFKPGLNSSSREI